MPPPEPPPPPLKLPPKQPPHQYPQARGKDRCEIQQSPPLAAVSPNPTINKYQPKLTIFFLFPISQSQVRTLISKQNPSNPIPQNPNNPHQKTQTNHTHISTRYQTNHTHIKRPKQIIPTATGEDHLTPPPQGRADALDLLAGDRLGLDRPRSAPSSPPVPPVTIGCLDLLLRALKPLPANRVRGSLLSPWLSLKSVTPSFGSP